MNRRTLLRLVGRAGGVAAMLTTMKAMGLLHGAATGTERPDLPAGSGEGVKVAILGAGIAGMTAAYELSKAGYECAILEARDRAGGRCWTIRGGDAIRETDSEQTCGFDTADYLYFNPGPARIPHHHQGLLGYCKEFGVPLQVIVNENRACYFQDDNAFGGAPVLNRRVINDSRGYVAELLAKAISQNALEKEVSTDDQESILEMVASFGSLNADLLYAGSGRAGYKVTPGSGAEVGETYEPIDFSELLKADFWQYKMNFGEGFNQAATMLEPVGGMDRIAQAFVQQVGHLITYNTEVTQIRKTGSGVRLVYTNRMTGEEAALDANYVICTLPLSVLATLDTDFSPEYQAAIALGATSYVRAVKHAFQTKRRFWEEDAQIYGGISWTARDITQIWYPTAGFHQATGILLGAYVWSNDIGDRIAALPIAERLQQAVADGEAVHPGYGSDLHLDTGVSVAWGKIPYSLGGWIEWEDEARETAYPLLNTPDGPLYLAGEHLSYVTGWQEGAVLSAHDAVRGISAQLQAQRS
ncbi:MAG: flavin monoamine oxidase family protein [Synechococcales bacterium]|nr:flavin monoamine oxidase family protein [Synechococcales bacterium]